MVSNTAVDAGTGFIFRRVRKSAVVPTSIIRAAATGAGDQEEAEARSITPQCSAAGNAVKFG